MYHQRRVKIEGTIPEKDVSKLIVFVNENEQIRIFRNSSKSIVGLNNWIKPNVSMVGNIYCRTNDPDEIVNEWDIISRVFQSIDLKIHFGGLHGKADCIGTIIVRNGKIDCMNATMKTIPRVSGDKIRENVKDLQIS